MRKSLKPAFNVLIAIALTGILAWLLLLTGIWAAAAVAGVVACALVELRYAPAFMSGLAGGAVAALVWLRPLFDPGAGAYVAAIGALASIPGYLLVSLSFIVTALLAACGGVIGVWARHLVTSGRHARG